MASVEKAAHYDTVVYALTDATKTTVHTVQSGFWEELLTVRIMASAGAAGNAIIHWYDFSAATEYVVVYTTAVPFVTTFEPFHLDEGDLIKVTGAAAQNVFVTVLRGKRTN